MCGISGVLGRSDSILSQLIKMNDAIAHRGPDDEGYILINKDVTVLGGEITPKECFIESLPYLPSNSAKEHRENESILGLGHRRLAILDITYKGHMPMSYDDRYWIIHNGEIYNFVELREELQNLGYKFKSNTDSEVILASFVEWGEACLTRFIGMWSFAIYDHKTKDLFLSRDRFGIKPLYYWISKTGVLYFGSEIKQFTYCNGWESKLNKQRAYDYLFYTITDHTTQTLFKDVHQLGPGCFIKINIDEFVDSQPHEITQVRWYKLKEIDNEQESFEKAAIRYYQLFKKSIKLHMRSDVLVGTALSGGLDSSSIVCEINKYLKRNGKVDSQKTFSSVAHDERYSEKNWMEKVISHTKVEAHYVFPNMSNLFRVTDELLWQMDEPYQSQSVYLGYHVYSKAKEQGVKVLINGQGADEYLSAYGGFRFIRWHNHLRKMRISTLIQELNLAGIIGVRKKARIILRLFMTMIPASIEEMLARKSKHYKQMSRIFDVDKLGARELHPFNSIPVRKNTYQKSAVHNLLFNPLPKYLHWEDRISMSHSIEARVPFLDHRLVEFAYSQPVEYLDSPAEMKILLREAVSGILPSEVTNRKDKKGFITPEELWVKEENPAVFLKEVEKAIMASKGLIKPYALNYVTLVIEGKIPFDYTYWRIILFSRWLKIFGVSID